MASFCFWPPEKSVASSHSALFSLVSSPRGSDFTASSMPVSRSTFHTPASSLMPAGAMLSRRLKGKSLKSWNTQDSFCR